MGYLGLNFKQIDAESFFIAMKNCEPKWNGLNEHINFYYEGKIQGYISPQGFFYWLEEK